MRRVVFLLASLLLAGCTWGPTPPASDDSEPNRTATPGDGGAGETPGGGPDAASAPCLLLSVASSLPVFAVGQTTLLTMGVENCGDEPFPLQPPGRCSVGTSLMAHVESRDAAYWHYDGAQNGTPVDNALWAASHGPCFAEPPQPFLLPAGARHEETVSWNGTVGMAVREEIVSPPGMEGFTMRLVPGPIAPGWHNLSVSLRGGEALEEEWTAQAKVYVLPTRGNPDPTAPFLAGLSAWLPSPPPESPPARPETPEAYAARVAQRGPDEPPADAMATARAVLDWWAGPFADNFTFVGSEHVGMDAFCAPAAPRCDRYGWGDWHVLRFQADFVPNGTAPVEIPARAGGVVADEDVVGLPHCAATPEECVVTVDEADARRIAAEAGLANGTRAWEASFFWHRQLAWIGMEEGVGVPPATYGTFAWMVRNTLDEAGSHGEAFVIDANDGTILLRDTWSRTLS